MLQLEKSPRSNENPPSTGKKRKKESDLEKDQGTGEAREKGQDLPGQRVQGGWSARKCEEGFLLGTQLEKRLFLFRVCVCVCAVCKYFGKQTANTLSLVFFPDSTHRV